MPDLGPGSDDSDEGKDGDGRLGQPSFPLKVKNTFIDVEDNGIEDGHSSFRRRQMSEPAPSLQTGDAGSPHRNAAAALEMTPANESQPQRQPKGSQGNGKASKGGKRSKNGQARGGSGKGSKNQSGDSDSEGDPAHVPTAISDMDDEFAGMSMPLPQGLGGSSIPTPDWVNTTTVMMRNLPNKYSQRMLLSEINHTGFLGTFDFLYLPIDPDTQANRGYSFLNFIDPGFAWMFKMSYEGRKMNRFNSNKVVSVVPATLQGFEANYAHYAVARVNRGDPAARPLFLREPKEPLPALSMEASSGASQRGGRRRVGGPNNLEHVAAQQAQLANVAASAAAAASWAAKQMGTYYGLDGGDFNQMPYSAGCGGMADAIADTKRAGTGTSGSMVPKFCPHCGGSIQPLFQFCPHCGGSLDFAGASQQATNNGAPVQCGS